MSTTTRTTTITLRFEGTLTVHYPEPSMLWEIVRAKEYISCGDDHIDEGELVYLRSGLNGVQFSGMLEILVDSPSVWDSFEQHPVITPVEKLAMDGGITLKNVDAIEVYPVMREGAPEYQFPPWDGSMQFRFIVVASRD